MTLGNVLIAGGASGLGAAAVQAVQRHGGTPLVMDITEPDEDVIYAWSDLADTAMVGAAVTELADAVDGQLHGVFAPAGVDSCGPLDDVPAKDWERVLQANLLGTAAVVRSALPYLKATHGRIVTCGSSLSIPAGIDATAFCASKFGIVGFTRALAAELAGQVGVTLLIPDDTRTPLLDELHQLPADVRLDGPQNVAETVVFALRQPPDTEIREMVVCSSEESSWP
jgi:NAD(P)-dependent dehydrogenase (short-subunit alcohol dehydrogenase family)